MLTKDEDFAATRAFHDLTGEVIDKRTMMLSWEDRMPTKIFLGPDKMEILRRYKETTEYRLLFACHRTEYEKSDSFILCGMPVREKPEPGITLEAEAAPTASRRASGH